MYTVYYVVPKEKVTYSYTASLQEEAYKYANIHHITILHSYMATSSDSSIPILLVIYCSGDLDPVDTAVVKWRYRPTLDLTYEMIYWQIFLYTNTHDTIQELLYAFCHPICISLIERHTNIIGISLLLLLLLSQRKVKPVPVRYVVYFV